MNALSKAVNAVVFHGGCLIGRLFRADYERKARRGRATGERMLNKLLRRSRDTEYGRKYRFSEIRSVSDYRKMVPVSDYDDYRDYVRRTAENGEQGLMTGRRINYFATTSGTTRERKLIPQVMETYIPYFKCICVMLSDLLPILRERGVPAATAKGFVIIDTVGQANAERQKGKVDQGMVSSYSLNSVKYFLPLFTPFPAALLDGEGIGDPRYLKALYALRDADLKYASAVFSSSMLDMMTYILENWERLARDIETGTLSPDAPVSPKARRKLERALRPDPARAAELREIFSTPEKGPVMSRVWKQMSILVCIGGGDFTPFTEKLHTLFDPGVRHCHSLYSSSECTMGVALRLDDPSYLLLPDSGFFEFFPVEDGETKTDRILLPCELERGKYYEIVLTNLAGLYRYRLLDVVCVTDFIGETPCIQFAYRANNLTDICGIHLTGRHLADTVREAAQAVDTRVLDYSLYADIGAAAPHLELFLETERPLDGEERQAFLAHFEEALGVNCWDYGFYRENGQIGPAKLCPVRAGAFRRYRDMRISQGASANQIKALRLIDTPEKYRFITAEEDAEA